MPVLSYVIVLPTGDRLPGTDATGNFDSPEQLGQWWREQMPDAVEVSVWEGEFADRPDHALARLRELVARPSSVDLVAARNRVYAGANAVDVFEPRTVA